MRPRVITIVHQYSSRRIDPFRGLPGGRSLLQSSATNAHRYSMFKHIPVPLQFIAGIAGFAVFIHYMRATVEYLDGRKVEKLKHHAHDAAYDEWKKMKETGNHLRAVGQHWEDAAENAIENASKAIRKKAWNWHRNEQKERHHIRERVHHFFDGAREKAKEE